MRLPALIELLVWVRHELPPSLGDSRQTSWMEKINHSLSSASSTVITVSILISFLNTTDPNTEALQSLLVIPRSPESEAFESRTATPEPDQQGDALNIANLSPRARRHIQDLFNMLQVFLNTQSLAIADLCFLV